MSLELAKAWVKIRGDASGLRRDLENTKSEVKTTVGDLAGYIKGALAGLAGAAFVRRGLGLAGQFEQTKIAFDTMLGSAIETKKTLEDLTQFAAKTPFEMPEILQAARGLIQFGERGDDLMATLRMLGDASAGTSTNFGLLALIFNQIRGVGKLLTQDFRQLSTRGVLSLQDIADHFKVTTEEAQKMLSSGKISFEDVKAILAGLSNEGGRFANMMEKQSASYLGLMSTLTDNINIITREVGDKFLPIAKQMVSMMVEASDAIREMVSGGNVFAATFGALSPLLMGIGRSLLGINSASSSFFAVALKGAGVQALWFGIAAGVGKVLSLLYELDHIQKVVFQEQQDRIAEQNEAIKKHTEQIQQWQADIDAKGGKTPIGQTMMSIAPGAVQAAEALQKVADIQKKIQDIREKNATRKQTISGEGEIIKLGSVNPKMMADFSAQTNAAKAEYQKFVTELQAANDPIGTMFEYMKQLPPEAAALKEILGNMVLEQSGFEDVFHNALIDLERAKGEVDDIELTMRGLRPFITEDQAQMLESLLKQVKEAEKAKEKQEKAKQTARSLLEGARNPFQSFNASMDELRDLRKRGLLTPAQMSMLGEKARKEMEQAQLSDAERRLQEREKEARKNTFLESGRTGINSIGNKLQDTILQKDEQATRDAKRDEILEAIKQEQIKQTLQMKREETKLKGALTGED